MYLKTWHRVRDKYLLLLLGIIFILSTLRSNFDVLLRNLIEGISLPDILILNLSKEIDLRIKYLYRVNSDPLLPSLTYSDIDTIILSFSDEPCM